MSRPIIVYTDGAGSNNPGGPGGWAATLNYENRYDIISGYSLETTNNRMELTAVVQAVRVLMSKGYTKIIVNSDSAYVVNAFNKGWILDWSRNMWKTKQGTDVANSDLWKELYELYKCEDMSITFNKVQAHSGHTFNEIADTEAKKQALYAKRLIEEQF